MKGKAPMNLYLLERKDVSTWEEQEACVVAESNPRAARKIAQENAGGEGADHEFWLKVENVKCSVLAEDVKRESGMVLSSNRGA